MSAVVCAHRGLTIASKSLAHVDNGVRHPLIVDVFKRFSKFRSGHEIKGRSIEVTRFWAQGLASRERRYRKLIPDECYAPSSMYIPALSQPIGT